MRDYIQGKQEEKRRKKIHQTRFIVLGVMIVLCIVGFVWFLHSDIYIVARINVENINSSLQPDLINLSEKFVQDRSWVSSLFFNPRSFFGFGRYSLAKKISETYPILTDISISKNYFTRTITIDALERKKVALWCVTTNDLCWWFDDQGIIFLEGPSTQGQLINKVISQLSDTIQLGEKIPIEGDITTISSIFSFLDAINSPTKNIIWNSDLDEIQTDSHAQFPVIRFGVQQEPQYALTELKKRDIKNLAYIDLTITNRIYLCPRGAECDK